MLVEELAGLLNASVEQRPVLHNELNILDGQVNEHTSDLGGLGADDLLDELVEDRANLVLVVGVASGVVSVATIEDEGILLGLIICGTFSRFIGTNDAIGAVRVAIGMSARVVAEATVV